MPPLSLQILPLNGDDTAVLAALGGLVRAASPGPLGWLRVELNLPADLDPASLNALAARLVPVAVRVNLFDDEPVNA
ncbi:hypothetical protein [Actinotalea sp. Marseille-Q4924]|uniref:hypothetical protein n=1 Tax=Actinotalea sp. Marseille-Q4924 TaxID=2866571 RepID=UPI001CE3E01C|nr:hypothetical protein [Actinotalea sp. Marseille-Q4924]